MKTKIKLLLVTFLCLYLNNSNAQKIKLQAGLSFPSTTSYWDEFGEVDNFIINLGFLIGPSYKFPLNEQNELNIGVILNQKGFRSTSSFDINEYSGHDEKFKLIYLDFPFLYRHNFTLRNSIFFAEMGPYIGIGLIGKSKLKYKYNGDIKHEETVLFGKNSVEYLKKMDFGVSSAIGIKLQAWEFGLLYTHGIRDISKLDIEKMKHRIVALYTTVSLNTDKKK